MIFRSEN
jgi:hypothetical protein